MGICQSMFDQGTDVDVSEVSAPVFIILNLYVPQCMHSVWMRFHVSGVYNYEYVYV